MTDSTLSAAIREAYASAGQDIIYYTIEINHPAFTVPIRVVLGKEDITATLEASAPTDPSTAVTFTAFSFRLKKPDVLASGLPSCVLEIDNVSRDVLVNIEMAATSANLTTVIYREFLASNLAGGPENDPPLQMTVLAITADVFKVSATIGFADLVNRRFPNVEYTAEVFPGLLQ